MISTQLGMWVREKSTPKASITVNTKRSAQKFQSRCSTLWLAAATIVNSLNLRFGPAGRVVVPAKRETAPKSLQAVEF